MRPKDQITQAMLHEYLHYDPLTGHLTWIKKPSKNVGLGSRAGCLVPTTGYRSIRIFGRSYPEHQLIWCHYYGYWSKIQIDHINHIRDFNPISNLREVTVAENAQNRQRRKETKVNEAGIWFCRKRQRYIAEIVKDGKKVYQRTFIDVEIAIAERKLKLTELGFHPNHGS